MGSQDEPDPFLSMSPFHTSLPFLSPSISSQLRAQFEWENSIMNIDSSLRLEQEPNEINKRIG